jgi:hypothetical protein
MNAATERASVHRLPSSSRRRRRRASIPRAELAVLGLGSVPIQGAKRPSVYNQTAGERRACERGPQPHSFDRGPYAALYTHAARAARYGLRGARVGRE